MGTHPIDELHVLMGSREDEYLEFKEAKGSYHFEKLVKYCVALANEGGGKMVLGVTDKKPRKIVGTGAFSKLERTKAGLINKLHLRINVTEILHPEGRVLVFDIPSRPIGMPIGYKAAYWMRSGEGLAPMTPDMLKRIFDEGGPDFSAEICPKATLTDLDPIAVERFRSLWERKSGNEAIANLTVEQLLTDAEMILSSGVTYAALILLAKHHALGRLLPQAEVVFEYRPTETTGPAQQRAEHRMGFLLFADGLWDLINLRNDIQHFQDGLFVWDIPTFGEASVREAILNAVSHRDYRLAGSVFVRQFPSKLEVVSPGGFPPGITPENILWRQSPRNRRIAEVFAKCGLVERSGQGTNRIFEECARQSKPLPDFAGTDDYQVSLTLRGNIQDPQFLRFLEKVGREKTRTFSTRDFLVLDYVRREQAVPPELRPDLSALADQGIVEKVGRGRGVRYVLSRRYYALAGKKGVYTRKLGLDRETKKTLLEKHIALNASTGSRLGELVQVLPDLTRNQVKTLLRDLKAEGRAHVRGATRAALWFPGQIAAPIAPKSRSQAQ